MWIGWIEFDLLLGDVHSLKGKRALLRPLTSRIRQKFEVSVAEVGFQDLHRRTQIGVGVVASDRAHLVAVLDGLEDYVAEQYIAWQPDLELLSTRRRIITSDD